MIYVPKCLVCFLQTHATTCSFLVLFKADSEGPRGSLGTVPRYSIKHVCA